MGRDFLLWSAQHGYGSILLCPFGAKVVMMPKGPRGEKRPADVIGNAVKVMRVATGEETEELETDRAKSAAAELGSRGGKVRAARMSPERRREIARKAAKARWKAGAADRS
jgi:hypothetical protein